ncbi:MAG: M20/M25/M40 family metallo-hydrolase [Acidobacteria bacterium]|nr:MAG: M20/M25/M40 family metallo-hydrolase [Acidobacteriota bacterium]REJ99205.1 MAG: M20/M25/M40 family metallo-hydrolase [Acidobacteriota bacterium]REK16074.1 MAG: M20/M25/M40 family metallo-hydrolase [Acidobacteriota bacterium]REK43755.1 MAG: M20/M25/M40 family metallo-hydrolase [Acidobacteriota bacterium]
MLRRKFLAAAALYALLLPMTAFARTTDSEIYAAPKEDIEKIKAEGMGDNSQVMQTLSYMVDVIGGRLTNSPSMKRANEWTRDQMAKWGMKNAKLEAWGPWGRGWSLQEFSAQVVEPHTFPVIAHPKAWSPSTKGEVTGPVVHLKFDSEEDLAKYEGKLKGAIVLVGDARDMQPDFDGMGRRFTDSQLLSMANAPDPNLGRGGGPNFNQEQIQRFLANARLRAKAMKMLIDEGAAVMADNSSKGSGGTVFVSGASVAGDPPETLQDLFQGSVSAWDKGAESKMVPQMTMSTEHFNRLVRMIEHRKQVKMSVNIKAMYHEEDLMGYNTVAEIPGTDPELKDEVVMLGGHLDSWHAAGGATDNASGCAVAMEAARIIMATGLKPRRTIRVALWSGEEQGLNGSQEYVKQHFGEMQGGGGRFAMLMGQGSGKLVTKPAYDKFSAYYNMDNGTGKFRGVYLQGNSAVAPIFRVWLEPFKEMGAGTLTLNNTGGTDHLSFDAIGLPGFQFIQDPIEYSPLTHHSNQDNYDRLLADDLKHNSTIMAAFVYQTAMMDGKIPRKAPPGGAQ